MSFTVWTRGSYGWEGRCEAVLCEDPWMTTRWMTTWLKNITNDMSSFDIYGAAGGKRCSPEWIFLEADGLVLHYALIVVHGGIGLDWTQRQVPGFFDELLGYYSDDSRLQFNDHVWYKNTHHAAQ